MGCTHSAFRSFRRFALCRFKKRKRSNVQKTERALKPFSREEKWVVKNESFLQPVFFATYPMKTTSYANNIENLCRS